MGIKLTLNLLRYYDIYKGYQLYSGESPHILVNADVTCLSSDLVPLFPKSEVSEQRASKPNVNPKRVTLSPSFSYSLSRRGAKVFGLNNWNLGAAFS